FLSGGQQQRVALARVLAPAPNLLLLDEPSSETDDFRLNELRRNLLSYVGRKKITCVMATQDGTDVVSFSDEVHIMNDGRIVGSGIPEIVYKNPPDPYPAGLFGEFSEIYFNGIDKNIFYPHQLRVSGSGIRVTILTS